MDAGRYPGSTPHQLAEGPRPVDMPADFKAALDREPDAVAFFAGPTLLIPLNASTKRPTGGQGADNAC